jgi:hypothetical protein
VCAALQAKQGNRSNGIASHLAVLGLFVVLSLVLTYPLVKDLGSRILGAPAPGDNFEYLYKVWWFKHALFDLRVSPFFNADMFYPFGYNVALSETTISNAIPALPLTLLGGEVAAYNLLLLMSFVLSGFGMYLLALHLTGSRIAGLLSGIVFAFCPYRMAHLGTGHLPLMGTQWLPLLFLYLDRMVMQQRSSDAFMGALFYSLGVLSTWYYAYMFALAGLLYVLLRGRPWRQYLWQRHFAARALTFVVVCLLLVGPLALPVTQVWKEGDRPQSLRYVDHFSASPLDFVYPSVMQPLWGTWLLKRYPQNVNESILFLGLVPLVLGVIALRSRHSRLPAVFAWLSLIFGVMALGTTLHWGNHPVYVAVPGWLEQMFTVGMGFLTKRLALYPISSYSLRVAGAIYLPLPTLLLYLYLPFFSAMRVWARFGLVTIFGVSVLAGYGLQQLCKKYAGRSAGARAQLRGLLVTTALFGLVILEFTAFPYALGTCQVQARPVDAWLASQGGDFAIMEFPIAKAMSGRSLYAMRVHGKKIAFGYGTFFPRAFNEQRAVLESFPSRESIALLKDWDVRYVLLGSRSYGQAWPQVEKDLSVLSSLRHVLTLEDIPIYEGDRLLRLLPGTERAFVVDRIHVYEVL